MPRSVPSGPYARKKTVFRVPIELSQREANDLARIVEMLTERVVDAYACPPTSAYPFLHYALWIYGTLSDRRKRALQDLLQEYNVDYLNSSLRAPAKR